MVLEILKLAITLFPLHESALPPVVVTVGNRWAFFQIRQWHSHRNLFPAKLRFAKSARRSIPVATTLITEFFVRGLQASTP